jgi:hypothetical protein
MSDTRAEIVSWVNVGLTLAAIKFSISVPELITFLFVTVPVGIWSWWRVIDTWKQRKNKHGNPSE